MTFVNYCKVWDIFTALAICHTFYSCTLCSKNVALLEAAVITLLYTENSSCIAQVVQLQTAQTS